MICRKMEIKNKILVFMGVISQIKICSDYIIPLPIPYAVLSVSFTTSIFIGILLHSWKDLKISWAFDAILCATLIGKNPDTYDNPFISVIFPLSNNSIGFNSLMGLTCTKTFPPPFGKKPLG